MVFAKDNVVHEKKQQAVEKSCETLNTYLEGKEFVTGDNLTIADFTISTTICVLQVSIRRYNIVLAIKNRTRKSYGTHDDKNVQPLFYALIESKRGTLLS